MPNTHAIADSLNELMCTWGDLGPQVIVSHSGLTVPASSLTLAAVSANGYVLSAGPPARLVYVSQPAVSVTLSATNGNWWLAAHADLHTPVSGWTRRSGSHYLTQQAATQPANPSGGLVFAQVTVSGGVITAVSPLLPVTSQPMSKQNSNAVAITGGTASLGGHAPTGVLDVQTSVQASDIANAYFGLRVWPKAPAGALNTQPIRIHPSTESQAAAAFRGVLVSDQPTGWSFCSAFEGSMSAGTGRYNLYVSGTAPNHLQGNLGLGTTPTTAKCETLYDPTAGSGFKTKPTVESGSRWVHEFLNAAGTTIGTIATTSTATAYNTSSDHRLKHAITPLTDALARVQALRPVSFFWNADDSPGVGYLAHELQVHIPEAVTGEPDALNEDGSIRPQGVDHSRLVPWLTACCQELAAQVQALTARITTLEEALGL